MKKKGILSIVIGALIVGATGFAFAQNKSEKDKNEPHKMKITIVKDDNGTLNKTEEIIDVSSRSDVREYLLSKGINHEELNFFGRKGHSEKGHHGVWVYNTNGNSKHGDARVVMINSNEEESTNGKEIEKVMVKTIVVSDDDKKGTDKTEVRVEKKIDENGNVTIHKWVNGEEVDPDTKIDRPHVKMLEEGGEMIIEVQDEDGDEKVVKIKKEMDQNGNVVVLKSVNGSDFEEIQHRHGPRSKHHGPHRGHGFAARSNDGSILVFGTPILDEDKGSKKQSSNLNELELNELKFFPNPSEGEFTISFQSDEKGEVEINITDMEGKSVRKETEKHSGGSFNKTIELENAKSGIYLVEIKQNNKKTTKRLIVN